LAEYLGEASPEHRPKIPQHCVMEVFEALQGTLYDAFIRLDVKSFYPSIPHDRLASTLEATGIPHEVRSILMRAVRTPTVADRVKQVELSRVGVPQGIAVSNILAEFVAHEIDEAVRALGSCDYFRFVDDIIIFCANDDAQQLAAEAQVVIADHGLAAHPIGTSRKSATGLIADGFDYLGYEFNGPTISVRPANVHNLEARLARVFTTYKHTVEASKGNPLILEEALHKCFREVNMTITGFTHRRVEQGWIQYYRQLNDFKLLNQLDATVKRFRRRFNMPSYFQPKQFTRTYWAARYPNSKNFGYIPNLDKFEIEDQRALVEDILGFSRTAGLNDDEIQVRFRELADRFSAEFERDIGTVS
jgi:RNA-directed DNA polymerase